MLTRGVSNLVVAQRSRHNSRIITLDFARTALRKQRQPFSQHPPPDPAMDPSISVISRAAISQHVEQRSH